MRGRYREGLVLSRLCPGMAAVLALLPAAALSAQELPAAMADPILVTGSLMRGNVSIEGAPLGAIDAREIDFLGSGDSGELLRQWPGVMPASGSAMNNGNAGASFVNLRGLGAGRNLVLLDGARLAPDGVGGVFNLDNIPPALVERVDILTGGASATYGADAIAGVVNFVTRRDFTGLDATATGGITGHGDGRELRLDLIVGRPFAAGRGNLTVAASYLRSDPVYQGDRDFALYSLDSASGEQSGSPIGVPALLSGASDSGADFVALGCGAGSGVACATAVQGIRQIAPDGSGFSNSELYAPYNYNPWNLFRTPFRRFNAYASGRLQLDDSIEIRMRGLYAHDQVETVVAPSGVFGEVFAIPLNNPYLTAAMRAALCRYDVDPRPGYVPLYTPGECAAAAAAAGPGDPAFRHVVAALGRRAVETGPRNTRFSTDYFDYQLAAGGRLAAEVDWDISLSYGESRKDTRQSGYWRLSRVQQALLSGPDGCFDPADGCLPVDFFGPEGAISPAMGDFLAAEATGRGFASLLQGRALLSGKTGWQLPHAASPVSFAVGVEYRRYRSSEQPDPLSEAGDLGGMAGASPAVSGGYVAREAMAEILLPVAEGLPAVERLHIGLGLRHSDTGVDAAGQPGYAAWTWKVEWDWAIGAGVGVRGSRSRAVRAPDIAELFSPRNTSAANLAIDPCAGAAPLADANLYAVCLAQGAGPGRIGAIAQPASSVVNATTSGNALLQPEVADSWTVGFGYAPAWLAGFRASVDFYDVRVKSTIGTAAPGDAIAACFGALDAASATDPACTAIRRNPATGSLDGDAAGLWLPFVNLGRLHGSGVDLGASQSLRLAERVFLDLDFRGNWTTHLAQQATAGDPGRECAGFYSGNCAAILPKFSFRQRTTLAVDRFDLSLGWRFVGAVRYEPRQLAEDMAMARLLGCPDVEGADPYGCVVDRQFRRIGATHYFDLAAHTTVHRNIEFWLRVANLFDRRPQLVGDTVGDTSYNSGNTYPATYDALGRRFSLTGRLRF